MIAGQSLSERIAAAKATVTSGQQTDTYAPPAPAGQPLSQRIAAAKAAKPQTPAAPDLEGAVYSAANPTQWQVEKDPSFIGLQKSVAGHVLEAFPNTVSKPEQYRVGDRILKALKAADEAAAKSGEDYGYAGEGVDPLAASRAAASKGLGSGSASNLALSTDRQYNDALRKSWDIADIEKASRFDEDIANTLKAARQLQADKRQRVQMQSFYKDQILASGMAASADPNKPKPAVAEDMSDQQVADLVVESLRQREADKLGKAVKEAGPIGEFVEGARSAIPPVVAASALGPIAGAAGLSAPAAMGATIASTDLLTQGGRIYTGAQDEVDLLQTGKAGAIGVASGALGKYVTEKVFARAVKAQGKMGESARAMMAAGVTPDDIPDAYKVLIADLEKIRSKALSSGEHATNFALNAGFLLDEMQLAARGEGESRSWATRLGDFIGGYAAQEALGLGKAGQREPRIGEAAAEGSVRQKSHSEKAFGAADETARVSRLGSEEPVRKFTPKEIDSIINHAQEMLIAEGAWANDPSRLKPKEELGVELHKDSPARKAAVFNELSSEILKKTRADVAADKGSREALAKSVHAEREMVSRRETTREPETALPWKQHKQVLARIAAIEKTQGTPATPQQQALVKRMVQLGQPGIERALPPQPRSLPKTAQEKLAFAENVIRQSNEDITSPYRHFEQRVANIQRAARLQPSVIAPEMTVRRAIESGDRVFVDSKDGPRPITADESAILARAIGSGDAAVTAPKAKAKSLSELGVKKEPGKRVKRSESDYKITAEIVDRSGNKKKVTVYKDTPDGEWGKLLDLLKSHAEMNKSKGTSLHGGVPLKDIWERLFGRGGRGASGEAGAERLSPVDRQLNRQASELALNSLFDSGRNALSKVFGRRFATFITGESVSPSVKAVQDRADARRRPLYQAVTDTGADFYAKLNSISGGNAKLRKAAMAAVFDTLETQGRTQNTESSRFPQKQFSELLESGRKFGGAVLRLGKELTDAGYIPVARYQKYDAEGEKVGGWIAVTNEMLSKNPNALSDFERGVGLKDGERYELIGGYKLHEGLGHFLKHLAVLSDEGRTIGRGGQIIRSLGLKKFFDQTGRHVSAIRGNLKGRTETDIVGKESKYERSLDPTMDAASAELSFLGREFTLQEGKNAGLVRKAGDIQNATGEEKALLASVAQMQKRVAEIESEIESIRSEASKPRSESDKLSILALSNEKKGLNSEIRDARRRHRALSSGDVNSAWVALNSPEWGQWYDAKDHWYVDRALWHSMQSVGYIKPGAWRRAYGHLSGLAKSFVSVGGNFFRGPVEGFTNLAALHQNGVPVFGEGVRADSEEAIRAAYARVDPSKPHKSAELDAFLYHMLGGQFGGASTVEGMDLRGLNAAKLELARALKTGDFYDIAAGRLDVAVQMIQSGVDSLPAVGWLRKIGREMTDFMTAYYGYLRLRRSGLEGSGPMSQRDAAEKIRDMMDLRSTTGAVQTLATTPLIGADFIRYRAKVLEGYLKSLSLEPKMFGMTIPTGSLSRVIHDDPTSGRAQAAMAVRASARAVSKAIERFGGSWAIKAALLRAYSLDDDKYEEDFERSLDKEYDYMDPVTKAWTKSNAIPLGRDEFGDVRHSLTDFLDPIYTVPMYVYNGPINGKYNWERPSAALTSYSVLGSAINQDWGGMDYLGNRSGSRQAFGQKQLGAFVPSAFKVGYRAIDRWLEKDSNLNDIAYELAGGLFGLKVRVGRSPDIMESLIEPLIKAGHVRFTESAKGFRSLENMVDANEDAGMYALVDRLLKLKQNVGETNARKIILRIRRAQDEAVASAIR